MDDVAFKQLRDELVRAAIIGTFQSRELVFRDERRTDLKVYIYKEPNHSRPHVHIYFSNDDVSVCIKTRERLAGHMNSKLLRAVNIWVAQYEVELPQAWTEIQMGKKPELLWVKNAQPIS